MRCRALKKRMIELDGHFDPEMIRHAQSCSTCSALLAASHQLKQALQAADLGVPPLPFSQVRQQVLARSAQATRLENIMAYLRNQYQTRPGMAASLGLSILTVMLVAFATMVPFPYSAITGYKIMVTTSGAGPSPSSEQLTAALEDSGLQGATMTSGSDEGTYIVQGTVSETQVKQLADIIAEMSGTDATAQVEPIMSTVSGTLYAQVTGKHEPSKQQKPPLRLQDGHLHVDSSAVDSLGCPELYRDSNIVPSLEKVLRKTGLRNSDIGLAVQKASDQGYKIVWLATNRDSTTANMDSAKAVGLLMKSAGSKDVMALIMGNYPIDTAKLSVKFFDALNKRGLHPGRFKVNVSSSDDSSASAGKK